MTQTDNASGNSTNANQRQGGLTGQKQGDLSQSQVKSVLCFICQSSNHKQATCPLRVNTAGKSGQEPGTARKYACVIESRTDIVTGTEDRGPENQALSTGGRCNDGHILQATHVTKRPTVENQHSTDRETGKSRASNKLELGR